ncbi:MAG: M20/M25/M40 family metallo-hydrolase [Bryobacterales bacterium]|nr:M20/M25/M40 family metallo-hydrolase [Bryobacterales bacterium]
MAIPPRAGKTAVDALLEAEDLRAASAWFANNKAWILERQLAVCRVAAPTFLEEQRAELLREMLGAMGYAASLDAVGNVLALRDAASSRPLIVVSAHMDTVLAPRRPEDIVLSADGILHGPGVADNGAGLAGLLAMAHVFASIPIRKDWPCTLAFLANVGEEGEGNLTGMRYLCQSSPLAARLAGVLVLDGPGQEHITSRALASKRFEILMQGKGGHSWSDFGLANPNHALARAVAMFADAYPPERSNAAGRFAINVGVLQGGSTINAIPQSAMAKVDIRSERDSLIEELAAALARFVEQAIAAEHKVARKGRLSARLKEIGARPGGALQEDSPLLNAALSIDSALGIRSQIDTSSTDANIPLSMGIPALTLGAGGTGGGAHTSDEWYCPDARDLGLRRAFFLACAMLSGVAASPSAAGGK